MLSPRAAALIGASVTSSAAKSIETRPTIGQATPPTMACAGGFQSSLEAPTGRPSA